MNKIIEVYLNETNELHLKLENDGDPSYQYVYREAKGVHWNPKDNSFKSTPLDSSWSCAEWYFHIISVTSSIGIDMILSDNPVFKDIPEEDKVTIINS